MTDASAILAVSGTACRAPTLQTAAYTFRRNTLLNKDVFDRVPEVNVEPLPAGDFESPRVEPELVQYRGVNVGDVVAIFDGVEAQLVRPAMGRSRV